MRHYGDLGAGTPSWENWGDEACTSTARLYCLQTTLTQPVTVTPAAGRTMFVSSEGFDTSSGIAGADALCASDAKAAGFSGTYLALLATPTASAISRFDTTGAPWIRVDGIPIVAQASDMTNYDLIAPACLNSKGVYQTYGASVTGSATANAMGTAASTCNGWTVKVTTSDAINSRPDTTLVPGYTNAFGDMGPWPCGTQTPVICLQQ